VSLELVDWGIGNMEVNESCGVEDFAITCLWVWSGSNQDLVAGELPLLDLGDKVAD